ncbi:alpha/beta hydrolase [Acinetobacter cumulans]|uniref:Alpha/beta hydrolase n=1 Tax=Acinetobacter cumulans TaxID=2136182 RepID=A0A3A8GA37_9GAMM|nr:alpha/beta hydrolase [Acinetobacter cumulans]RKG55715.1 alpha/beta hydrolase [Acinetobacter cumulans]
MNIIFIHGMNQQLQTAQSLEKRWLSLLEQGLRQTQQPELFAYLKQHFRMPFYGDLLSRHHLHNMLNAGTLLPQTWPHWPLMHPDKISPASIRPETLQLKNLALPEMPSSSQHSFSQQIHMLSALGKDYALRDFALLMNCFPKLHATLLHKFLVETYLYLSDPHFMRAVHARLHEQLHQSKPAMLIAHSLGSVIAYHFLLLHPELNIQRFITIGSPLAFRVIQSRLPQPLQRPSAISGDWINFYSHDDFLTAFPLKNAPFNFSPAIINHQIRTSIDRPHEISGYLTHPEVIGAIVQPFKKPA